MFFKNELVSWCILEQQRNIYTLRLSSGSNLLCVAGLWCSKIIIVIIIIEPLTTYFYFGINIYDLMCNIELSIEKMINNEPHHIIIKHPYNNEGEKK